MSPNPPNNTNTTKPPVEPDQNLNFFSRAKKVVENTYGSSATPSSTRQYNFDPSQYSDVKGANYKDNLQELQRLDDQRQSVGDMLKGMGMQFGANVVSSIGQGLANTWDLSSNYKTLKGIATGSNDDFTASLFGLSTKDMQDWANGVAQKYQIKGGDGVDLTNGAWWAKQIASTGTGIGMGLVALGETALIEGATGGLGTGVALAKLSNLIKNVGKGIEGAKAVEEGLSVAKGLRSAATIYGVMSRVSESKMEGMQSYSQIYDELGQAKNADGSAKFTEAQRKDLASQGARRDYAYNMALLPLDILSYRMMVFNPISGSGEGAIEKGLEHLAGAFGESGAGKATGWAVSKALSTIPEGAEEGWQQWGQDEGDHYAKVLGGLDDGSTYAQRLNKEVRSDDFWNNFAGGIIGAPVIGGAMNIIDHTLHGAAKARQAEYYQDYIKNIAKMDSDTANKIKAYQDAGSNKSAQIEQQQFFAQKALGALHLDAMTNKNQAFDSLHTFLQGTLEELKAGKTDALNDLGFNNLSPDAIDENKKVFEGYLKDANSIKGIYDGVKDKYTANFIPTITMQHFSLQKLAEAKGEVEQNINKAKTNLYQYNQLTPNGKELYDSEYKMQAHLSEQTRLNELLRQAKTPEEKENIDKVVKENNERLTQVAQRLKDINSEETYNSQDKTKDAEIIESAITNKDYQQGIKDLEGINNSMSIGRKNLTLWNKPAFQAKMKKQAIENARTPDQVDTALNNTTPTNANNLNTANNGSVNSSANNPMAKNGNTSQESTEGDRETAEKKKTELNAQNIATNPNLQEETGNSELSDFDNAHYEDIKGAADEFHQAGVEPELQFAPVPIDFNKSSEEAKNKVKNGVGGILGRIGGDNASFEDLVRDAVKTQGTNDADHMYNALKYGWEANGRQAVDYDTVYTKVFGNPYDELRDGFSQLVFQTEKEIKDAVKETAQITEAYQLPPTVFNSDNQPVYIYKGAAVTRENQPKLAFLSRMSDLILNDTEEGTEVDQEFSEDDLNSGDYVSSLPLLDPDRFRENTSITIKIPTNFNDMLVPIYNADGTKGKAMTFGRWVAEKGINQDSQEYKDKIPMIIYEKGKEDQKGVALVHDAGWYHPIRFDAGSPEEMKQAIESTRAIRQEVIDSKGEAGATITGKRETTFNPFILPKEQPLITLREANPQTQLGVVLNSTDINNVYTEKPKTIKNAEGKDVEIGRFVNNNRELTNVKPHSFIGQILDIRRFGKNGDKETYIASPIFRQKIDKEAKNSMKSAIAIYATNIKGTLNAQQIAFHKSIIDNMGLDIKGSRGLQKYLEHFIRVENVDKADSNAKAEAQVKATLDAGTPFITLLMGGNIAFGQASMKMSSQYSSYWVNPNSAKNDMSFLDKPIIVNGTNYPDFLSWYETNLNLNNFESNRPIVTIDEQGSPKIAAPTYNDYLLDRLKTDIKSYNIGTKENPKYITNAQPIITYNTNKRLQKQESDTTESTTGTKTGDKTTINSSPKNVTGISTNETVNGTITETLNTDQSGKEEEKEDVLSQIRDAEELARQLLGSNFGTSLNGTQFSPVPITDKQAENIAKSIDRISGLTIAQQEHVIDYLYNNIINLVDKNGGTVSRKEVSNEVEKLVREKLEPAKKRLEDTIPIWEKLVASSDAAKQSALPTAINDAKYVLSKYNSLSDNLDLVKDLAFKKVDKYTNISVERIVREENTRPQNEEDEDRPNTGEEEGSGRDVDFYTDALQESPENKLTKAMRRFFGQIQKLDTNGTPVKGFLDLDTYENPDNIVRKLMTTLADVPSDFETMIDRLEKSKVAISWMEQAITKLRNGDKEKQNGFVYVMSNTSLRSKFAMISYNQKNQTWTTRIMDTNLSGVADAVKSQWKASFLGDKNSLTVVDTDGNYILNKDKARGLINTFEGWKGVHLNKVDNKLVEPLWTGIVSRVNVGKPQTFVPTGELSQYLKTNIVKQTDRVQFSLKGHDFQISKGDSNTYKIDYLNKNSATEEEVGKWLEGFGIKLSKQTLQALKVDGLYHNYKQVKWNELFDNNAQTNGLLGILNNKLSALLEQPSVDFTEYGDSPLDNTVVKSLATLESRYNDSATPFGFRDNGKQFFALTAPKFMTDRARELKADDGILLGQLDQISFSQPSMELRLLKDKDFRSKYGVYHLGATAMKQLGKKIYRDNGITNLADIDHEITKLTFFWDRTQGELNQLYPDTTIPMKMATMFGLTNSDKSTIMAKTTGVLDLETAHLQNGISDDVVKVLYEQLVKPELQRMIKFHQNGSQTNIKDYDKGAAIFNFLPNLNNLEYSTNLKLVDAIKNQPFADSLSLQAIEGNKTLRNEINKEIKAYVDNLVSEKLQAWEDLGFIEKEGGENGETTVTPHFFDNKYLSKFRGDTEQVVKMAATDYVVNSVISNANSFMIYAGDPALFYKSKSKEPIQKVKDTFVNVGKRLALLIAPGTPLANSDKEEYIQLFLKDRESSANNLPYLRRLLGEEEAKSYEKIEAADAQEYTTWKEHLHVLELMGRTADIISNITPQDIREARELLASGKEKKDLTEKQLKLVKKVFQPIKPVFAGQIYDKTQDVMRTMYIKSSSFPLLPYFTAGLEIDKLRDRMQKLEDDEQKFVRASYQTANKVGAISTPLDLWDDNGNAKGDNLKDISKSQLVLPRKYFKIQQDVPFKSGKNTEDKQTLGTQLMKLLFGDDIMKLDGFNYNGKSYTGADLHTEFTKLHLNLLDIKKDQLFDELGLDKSGNPIDKQKTQIKLQKLLKDEATNRGYPLQDIEALELDANGDFKLPLWASNNSNRYEAMLNSIVSNRMVKMKMPGNSYVVGSEEGIKSQVIEESSFGLPELEKGYKRLYRVGSKENDTGSWWTDNIKDLQWYGRNRENPVHYYVDVTTQEANQAHLKEGSMVGKDEYLFIPEKKNTIDIKRIKRFDLSIEELRNKIVFTDKWQGELKASYTKDGKLEKSQILVASKFRDNEGNLTDLFAKKNGEYTYIKETPTGFTLNTDMFDKELLDLLIFRIPTSGLQSSSSVEIVGFLPAENADLMIAPKNFTKQMGQDFDVDKANSYQLWHYMDEDGKFRVMDEAYKQKILAKIDTHKEEREADLPDFLKEAYDLFDMDIPLDQKDINDDKRLKHISSKIDEKLIQNEMVKMYHSILSNPSDEVQKKIVKTLNTDFAEKEADFIESLSAGEDDKYWTPLSDEYQKNKMFLGSSGKIGTGAYSLDVVFHSLVQQSKNTGKPLRLIDGEGNNKVWRFGEPKFTSYSILGESNTKGGNRSISDVLSERQNISVDNEKLQVMGRVDLNDITLDVDKVFNFIGLDKGENGHSISFLFLSQPIIKDFVKEMKNANSNMAEYEADKEQKIIDALIAKYDPQKSIEGYGTEEEYWDAMSNQMTNANMINGIQSKGENGALQAAILRRFIEMRSYGIAIRKIQTTLNFKNNSLGKSFFDVIEKRNDLNKLAGGGLVKGATNLVGDYRRKIEVLDPTDIKGEKILPEIIDQGYVDIGDYVVKPDTIMGAFNIHAVSTAYNTWKNYLPYDATYVQKAFDELMPIIGNGDNMGTSKTVELKQEVFKGIKKYINASTLSKIIAPEDNPNEERRRLYIDSEENTSLARYIKEMMQTQSNPVIDQFLKTNKLFNRFEFDVQKNEQPSLIKYNNASGEEFDEQYLYEALAGLLTARNKEGQRISLPVVGNKSYTLDSLAQDLIAYCYLGNSTQEAIQFTKYIPMSYLNEVGYSRIMNLTGKQFDTNQNILGSKIGNEKEGHMVSRYTMQFIQHNPERVKSPYKSSKALLSSIVNANSKKLSELTTFQLKDSERDNPIFISTYDSSIPKGEKKFRLFWFDGIKYNRIPVLGTFGMDEYQSGKEWGESLVNGRVRVKAQPQAEINKKPEEKQGDVFNVNSGDISSVLENIGKGEHGSTSILAKELLKYAATSGIKIEYNDHVPAPIKYNGLYIPKDNTIYINDKELADKTSDFVARIITHEVIHGLTTNNLYSWIAQNADGSVTVKDSAPSHITSLVRLFNQVKQSVDSKLIEETRQAVLDKSITTEQYEKYYGLTDIYEFMTMALTEPAFQKQLNEIKLPSGQSILDKFKELISTILSKIGIDINSDGALKEAFSAIFNFIEESNSEENIARNNNQMYESAINGDFDEDSYWDNAPPPDFGEHQDGETEYNMSPFPTKALDIRDENCL